MGQNLEFYSRVLEWNSRFLPKASLPHCPGAAAANDHSADSRGYLNPVWVGRSLKTEREGGKERKEERPLWAIPNYPQK